MKEYNKNPRKITPKQLEQLKANIQELGDLSGIVHDLNTEGLFGYLIQNSTEQENIVLDTFGGSGTSIIACEQLNRICYTMELCPRYCDAIIARWEKLTGSKANKIKGIE